MREEIQFEKYIDFIAHALHRIKILMTKKSNIH